MTLIKNNHLNKMMPNQRQEFDQPEPGSERPERPCSLQVLVGEGQAEPSSGAALRDSRKSIASGSVNSFIQKTYRILQEKKYESIIAWSDSLPHLSSVQPPRSTSFSSPITPTSAQSRCNSFRIFNIKAFEEIVLPQYFKHSNMSSFVRQLNMYNFHKVRGDKNEFEFEHEKFVKNRPDLLQEIKRKQVDSSFSIPSISLLPMPDGPEPGEPRPAPRVSFGGVAFKTEQHFGQSRGDLVESERQLEINEQKESSSEDMSAKLAQLQELNRVLKKTRIAKSNTLKQLNSNSLPMVGHKFNKMVLSLVACKIQREASQEEQQARLDSTALQELLQQILDDSPPRTFRQYYQLAVGLMQGKAQLCSIRKIMSDV